MRLSVRATLAFIPLALGCSKVSLAADLCADAPTRQLMAERISQGKGTYISNAPAGVSEVALADAVPEDRRTGVSAQHFQQIWDLMRTWKDPSFTLKKSGSIFLIRGPLPTGAPSILGSKYFNLDLNTPRLTGHLRPDMMAVIYATKHISSEGEFGMVSAYDEDGAEVFSVLAYPDGTAPVGKIPVLKPKDVAAFKEKMASSDPSAHEHPVPKNGWYPNEFLSTFEAMKALPQYCRSK